MQRNIELDWVLKDENRVIISNSRLSDRKRLHALHSTEMMDSPSELAFDRLVRLAAHVLHVPFVSVSFVSDTKQFLKASFGLPASYDTARDFPLDESICRYVLNGEPLIVENASTDPFLRHHLGAKKWGIVATLALPLVTAEGHVLGAFFAADTIEHRWSAADLWIFQELTAAVMAEIEWRVQWRQLQSRSHDRRDMLATIAHDLRTPITAASLLAQRLADTPPSSGFVKTAANRIVHCMSRTSRMIGDLLDASRIEAGQSLIVNRRWYALGEVLADILEELVDLYGPRFVLIGPSQPCEAYCDADAIRRVVENLAANAAKYGQPGTPITVRLQQAQNQVFIGVHNVGNPIPMREQPLLFEPYHRAVAARESRQSGWGIGLGIVRGLIEAHHGKVSVQSSEDAGTTFTASFSQCSDSTSQNNFERQDGRQAPRLRGLRGDPVNR